MDHEQDTLAFLPIAGTWEGEAVSEGAALKIRLHFSSNTETNPETNTGTIDFPSWNTIDWSLDKITYTHPQLHFEIPGKQNDIFDGQLDGDTLTGTLRLWGRSAAVRMIRVATEPIKPYSQDEVYFENEGITLSGTLLIPHGNGPHPAIIFLHGSGIETRDRNRFLADHFARRGVATLIYDKRGTGASQGDWEQADFDQLAADASAGIRLIENHPAIDGKRIGVFGHSQGGWLTLITASRSNVAFIVAVCGPTVTGAQQMLYAVEMRVRQANFAEADVQAALEFRRQVDSAVREGKNRDQIEAIIESAKPNAWYSLTPYEMSYIDTWARIMDFEPVPLLKNLQTPILNLFGEEDMVVDTLESVSILEGVRSTYGKDITIHTFVGANHSMGVFPTAATPFRWFGMAEGYVETMTEWVLERVRNDIGV